MTNGANLIQVLQFKTGWLYLNSLLTGVDVYHAMVPGGPCPATSNARTTSVEIQAIYHFTRLVCYQGFLQSLLPYELKDTNTIQIIRLVKGKTEL